jgi:branched-chain amino acid transport system permease protein
MDALIFSQLILSALVSSGMYALMSLGLTLMYGVLKVVNLSHGQFYMLGAFVAYWCLTLFNLDPIISIIVAATFGFILGIIVEEVIIRSLRRSAREEWVMNSFVMILGLSIIMQN